MTVVWVASDHSGIIHIIRLNSGAPHPLSPVIKLGIRHQKAKNENREKFSV